MVILLGMAALQVYNQIYNTTVAGNGGATALNYTSPVLHTVVLSNLKPGTRYFYQVGDGTTYSATYNFTALAAPSESPSVALQNQQRFHMPSHEVCCASKKEEAPSCLSTALMTGFTHKPLCCRCIYRRPSVSLTLMLVCSTGCCRSYCQSQE